MTLFRTVLLTSGLSLALHGGTAQAQTLAQDAPGSRSAIAPAPGDIKVENTAQDRFYNTDLDKALKAKGISTIIMFGWSVNGGTTYTSVGATAHGYTVVVPVDLTGAATDYATAIGFYQI